MAIWAVTIGILALVIAISDPGTQTRALAVSPIVLLTCWLRHIDVIRTGIPLVALSGGGRHLSVELPLPSNQLMK